MLVRDKRFGLLDPFVSYRKIFSVVNSPYKSLPPYPSMVPSNGYLTMTSSLISLSVSPYESISPHPLLMVTYPDFWCNKLVRLPI